MALILLLLTHVLIFSASIIFLVLILRLILSADTDIEKLTRVIALAIAILSYFGSRAVGLDVPALLLHSVGVLKPLTLAIVGALLPSLAGYLSARVIVKGIKSDSEEVRIRMVVLISTLLLLLFSDVYVATFSKEASSPANPFLLPNLSFAVGVGLYVILNIQDGRATLPGKVANWKKWR